MTVLGIIPARYASSRFPGKALAMIAGKSMIQRVWERTRLATSVDEIVVATDDERIAKPCAALGIRVVMTSPHHPTGTDRLAEVARKMKADIYLNVQGDEPLIAPAGIDAVVDCLKSGLKRGIEVATAYLPGTTPDQDASTSCVHLVPTLDGRVLTFSRLPIPFDYKERAKRTVHLGLYAFTGGALQRFADRKIGPVERAEGIELMRFLEYGESIACVAVVERSIGVDHPEDIVRVEAALAAQKERA